MPEFASPGTTDSGAEVAIVKAKFAKTEAEIDALRAQTTADGGCSCGRAQRVCEGDP